LTVRTLIGRTLIALVVINAGAGVAALVLSSSKQIGSFEAHILLTTGAVSLAAATGLPCALAWEKRGFAASYALPLIGIAVITLAMAFLVALIWTDDASQDLNDIAWSLTFAAGALSLINLLSLAELRPSQGWVRLVAYGLAVVLAAQLIVALWQDDPSDGEIRRFAITTILLTGASSVVPILQRLGEQPQREAPAYCPRCGAALTAILNRQSTCPVCGAAFRVEFS
jgi:hypothetical protein